MKALFGMTRPKNSMNDYMYAKVKKCLKEELQSKVYNKVISYFRNPSIDMNSYPVVRCVFPVHHLSDE